MKKSLLFMASFFVVNLASAAALANLSDQENDMAAAIFDTGDLTRNLLQLQGLSEARIQEGTVVTSGMINRITQYQFKLRDCGPTPSSPCRIAGILTITKTDAGTGQITYAVTVIPQ